LATHLARTAEGAEPAEAASTPAAHDADAQFKYGLAEMLAGRYATGCPALETSYRLDPRAGTLFTLAECLRKAGKTSSALASYDEYLSLYARMTPEQRATQRERVAIATEERAALMDREPRPVVPEPPPPTPAPAPSPPAQPAPQQSQAARVPRESPPLATTAATGAGSRRTWVYVSGGVGVAGLLLAGGAGALSIAKRSTASSDCNAGGVCMSQQGVDAGNAARNFANVATVGWVVGGVGLAAAIILWLTEPGAPPRNVAWLTGRW
jgi:hypothetical protein